MKTLNEINPESFRFNQYPPEAEFEDVIEDVKICSLCKGEIIEGKCVYGCDDLRIDIETDALGNCFSDADTGL